MSLNDFTEDDALNILYEKLPNHIWPKRLPSHDKSHAALEARWQGHHIVFKMKTVDGSECLEVGIAEATPKLGLVDPLTFQSYVKNRNLDAAIQMVNTHLLHLGQAYKELDALCMQEIQPLLDEHNYDQAMLKLHGLRISKSKVGQDIFKRIVDEAHANGEVTQLIPTDAKQLIKD